MSSDKDRLVGECTGINEDLEKQPACGASLAAVQYGATEPLTADASKGSKQPVLTIGRFTVTHKQLWKCIVGAYVINFAVRRLADLFYLLTLDGRFPAGLGYLYPNEMERQQTIRYTRLAVATSMGHQIVTFTCVMMMVRFQLFRKVDELLKAATTSTKACCVGCFWCSCLDGPCMAQVFDFMNFIGKLVGAFLCCPCRCCGINLKCARILRGAVYLTLFAAFFMLVGLPFKRIMHQINIIFGFTNTISITPAMLNAALLSQFVSLLVYSVPMKVMFLTVLSCRFGWVLMWAALIMGTLFAQFNFKRIAPQVMGMNNVFPDDMFAAGRGFPLARVPNPAMVGSEWVDLNRIYYKDPYSPTLKFSTKDHSRGPLDLFAPSLSSPWTIASTGATVGTEPYAKSDGSVADITRLGSLSWHGENSSARVGIRSGHKLRDEVLDLAKRRNIGVGQIYMVDGSSKDVRANAFVGGFGKQSVIGLYDTLFLGQKTNLDMDMESPSKSFQELPAEVAGTENFIQQMSDAVQEVDASDDGEPEPPLRSAPTQAMNDDEIVSILAHEFGHADLGHLFESLGVQAVTSFLTFAALGFMAHSEVVAAALGLPGPLAHVGALAFDHVTGPAMNGVLKFLSDARTRKAEYEADAYAAEVSERYATALQTSLAKVTVNSNQDPDPPWFYDALHADHPSYGRRWANIDEVKRERYGEK